ncbi:MAG: hypothetical protein AB7F75_08880 [Planctomycetota bacterium]
MKALGQCLTLLELGDPDMLSAVKSAKGPMARVTAFTGAPGAGKSSLIAALLPHLKGKVGVLASDPSSRRTGGALLGDRTRVSTQPENVFYRSMATRGASGSLAAATEPALALLALCGYETILLETVGSGQQEASAHGMAHTLVLVLSPEAGDHVQLMKAGVLEDAGVIVVTRGSKPEAVALSTLLDDMLSVRRNPKPKVLVVDSLSGQGVGDVALTLQDGTRT